jgi:hypothetical protein
MFEQLWHRARRFHRTLVRHARASVRAFIRLAAQFVAGLPACLRWLRSAALFPLWLSFEAYVAGWEWLEREGKRRWNLEVRDRHYLLYCLALSLTVTQTFCLRWVHAGPSSASVLLSIAHGLATYLFWKRGRRWCRQLIGVRPRRYYDLANPHAGLDFGQ